VDTSAASEVQSEEKSSEQVEHFSGSSQEIELESEEKSSEQVGKTIRE
jgi:hypothetical protein